MRTKDIIAIICLVALATLGGWLFYKYYILNPPLDNENYFGQKIEKTEPSQHYTNTDLNFGFRYPEGYEITREYQVDKSDQRQQRQYELVLTLSNFSSPGQPKLNLYVNQEVPIARADRTLTLLQDDVGLYLADIFEDKSLDQSLVRTVGSLVMSNDNVYTWEFIFKRGRYDYQPDLESMLDYFGIFRTVEEVEEEIEE